MNLPIGLSSDIGLLTTPQCRSSDLQLAILARDLYPIAVMKFAAPQDDELVQRRNSFDHFDEAVRYLPAESDDLPAGDLPR